MDDQKFRFTKLRINKNNCFVREVLLNAFPVGSLWELWRNKNEVSEIRGSSAKSQKRFTVRML